MPLVKICGLTRVEDVVLAARLGAWAVGFVFAPSPRRLEPAAARALIAEARELLAHEALPGAIPARSLPLTVGVFVDEPAEEIAAVVQATGLDCVQLHGSQGDLADAGGSTRVAAVRAALQPLVGGGNRPAVAARSLLIQAVPVSVGETEAGALREAIRQARQHADLVLLDSNVSGRFGGTGESFAWSLAREAADGGPLLVAGGIGPDNAEAALQESGAWGIDVSSRIETAPGVKDPAGMTRLFANLGVAAGPVVWPGARAGASAGSGADLLPAPPARAGGDRSI